MKRRTFAAATLVFTTGFPLLCRADEKTPVAPPKPITLKATARDMLDHAPGITTFASAEELAKKNPKLLEKFDHEIDFAKEDLILVQWGSSGPPFGKLTYKTEKTSIIFAVEEPKVQIRGQAYKLGADWFTVVKGTKIVFTSK